MAKRGRKGNKRYGRRSKRRGSVKTPRTIRGVWSRQPLLVKAGMGLTALEIGGKSLENGVMVAQIKAGQYTSALNTVESQALNLMNYKPLAYGVIGHWVAKQLKIKGL